MKLTTNKLYQLIMEQMQRMFQAPLPLADRIERDPDIPPEHKEKLLMLLRSGDEEMIASAGEMMEIFGYGEDYATTDIPLDNFSLDGDERQFYYRDQERRFKRRKSDLNLGRHTKTKPHQKFALDAIVKKYFDKFKERLPTEVMYDEEERGSNNEQRRLADLMEDIVSSFFEDTEEAFDDMAGKNFFGFSWYENILTDNMIIYYDNIIYKRNNPIDSRFM